MGFSTVRSPSQARKIASWLSVLFEEVDFLGAHILNSAFLSLPETPSLPSMPDNTLLMHKTRSSYYSPYVV